MHKSRSAITLDMNIEKKEFIKDNISSKLMMSKLNGLEDVDGPHSNKKQNNNLIDNTEKVQTNKINLFSKSDQNINNKIFLKNKEDDLQEEDLTDENKENNYDNQADKIMSSRVEKKSRENSRDRPRDEKEKKKKNKLVFKNNIMNKLEIPTGSMTNRNIGLELNNNIVNKNNEIIDPNHTNSARKHSVDESNVQDELKDIQNQNINKRNISPTQESVIDTIPELNLQAMNSTQLNNVGQQILNQDNENVQNDLQKLINRIKQSENDTNNQESPDNDTNLDNNSNPILKRPLSSTGKDNRPNSLSQLPHCQT